ncbi:MAG: YlbF family regulator [Ruminococcaceae bacterium]|nr:YlbF family regulator [Oscillospiraceae bacterium]
MDILEQAQILGKLIAESDEYLNMKKAEEAQLADETAQAQLAAYNELTNEFSMKVRMGEPSKEEMEEYKEKLTSEYQKLNENPTIKEYIYTQQAFDALMKKINTLIAQYVVPQGSGGCSGSCDSCGGCH